MNPFSTPYENVLSLLSTSDAWKKYFPGIQKEGLKVEYKLPEKSEVPSMKGIDFTTGKNVDLGKYWADKGTDVSNFWNPEAAAEPPSNELNPPTYDQPASPLDEESIKRIIDYQRGQTSRTRAEEAAYNFAMLPILQNAVLSTRNQIAGADLQNRSVGATLFDALPTQATARNLASQQAQALASGAFATELDAVSQAASRARRDVVAGLMAGRGRGTA